MRVRMKKGYKSISNCNRTRQDLMVKAKMITIMIEIRGVPQQILLRLGGEEVKLLIVAQCEKVEDCW